VESTFFQTASKRNVYEYVLLCESLRTENAKGL
jgi:hypothetical protein